MHGNLYLDEAISWDWAVNRGLVSRWSVVPNMTRGTVKWWDLCRRNPGTLTGMTPATAWSGKTHTGGWGSLDFDGTDDLVNCGTAPSTSGYLCFSAWCKPDVTNVVGSILGVGKDAGYANLWNLYLDDVALFKCSCWGPSGQDAASSSTTVVAGTWYHVMAVMSQTYRQIYVNGKPGTSNSTDAGAISPNQLKIGIYPGPVEIFPWNGCLDDVRLHNRYFSDAEVLQLYEDSLEGSPRSLNWIRRKAYSFQDVAATTYYNRLTLMGCGV